MITGRAACRLCCLMRPLRLSAIGHDHGKPQLRRPSAHVTMCLLRRCAELEHIPEHGNAPPGVECRCRLK